VLKKQSFGGIWFDIGQSSKAALPDIHFIFFQEVVFQQPQP
jgi:hypothetical protein